MRQWLHLWEINISIHLPVKSRFISIHDIYNNEIYGFLKII